MWVTLCEDGSQRTGAIYPFFFCLAVKLMVTHYCTEPIWAQLVPLMLSVELLPIKMIVWVSNAPFRSCSQSLPLTLFVHVCPFSCLRRWELYIQGRFSSNPLYLIWSNLLDCAHGRRKSSRDIWYSPTLCGHWNQPIFTFILDVPVCPWPGANCFFTHFHDCVMPNWENDVGKNPQNICRPYLDATQASCNCSSRNFIIFNMLEMIFFKWEGNRGIINCLQLLLFPGGKTNRLATSEETAMMKEFCRLRQRIEWLTDWLNDCCASLPHFPTPDDAGDFSEEQFKQKPSHCSAAIPHPGSHMVVCAKAETLKS